MRKKSNVSETLFAVLCIVGVGAMLAGNNSEDLTQWATWAQGVSVGVGGSFAQAAIGFIVVSALGGIVLWYRKPATELDADGNPVEIDYSSPDWIRVEVIR